jgi:hypothetical protein
MLVLSLLLIIIDDDDDDDDDDAGEELESTSTSHESHTSAGLSFTLRAF